MGQVPQQSADYRTFRVYAPNEDTFTISASSVSVDDEGYLSFYKREEGATGFLPVAGFPKGFWSGWEVIDG